MENIIIKIKSDLMNYEMKFEHTLNIVKGYSATGKTLFFKIIDARNDSGSYIYSNYKFIHLNSEIVKTGITLNDDYVYLMDESDGIIDKEIIELINSNKYKFILFTRELSLNQISYGIDQIYEFKRSGKYNILKRMYEDNLNNKEIDKSNLNSILTEDSNSGYQFYKNYKNFNVKTSNGNSNINELITNNQIVVIDSVGFGPYIKELIDKYNNNNSYVLSPKSFEWLILTSNIFRISDEILEKEYNKYKITTNKENFYLKMLKLKSDKLNIRYSKSKLNQKFLEENQFNKINNRIVELFNIDIKDLNKNLNNQINMGWDIC